MNYLDVLIELFLLLCVFLGLYQGLIRSALAFFSCTLGLVGAALFWKIMAIGFVRSGTVIPILLNFSESDEYLMGAGETYGERLMTAISNIRTPVDSLSPDFLEKLTQTLKQPIIHPIDQYLVQNVQNKVFAGQATMLGEYLSLTLAYLAIAVVSFILVFCLFTAIFYFLSMLADAVFRLPMLKRFDSLCGACAGLMTGFFLLLILGMLIPVMLGFLSMPFIQETVETSIFAGWMYTHNPLLMLFKGFTG